MEILVTPLESPETQARMPWRVHHESLLHVSQVRITYRVVFQPKGGKRLEIVTEVKNRTQMSINRDPQVKQP